MSLYKDQISIFTNLIYFAIKIIKIVSSFQVTRHPVFIVRLETMISASLDIESSQVEARLGNILLLKQVIGDLTRHELVHELHGGGHQTSHHLVNHLGLIQHVRIEEPVPDNNTHVIVKCDTISQAEPTSI